MSEPLYDQRDADLYYEMQELRAWRKRAERAEATLAAIHALTRPLIGYVSHGRLMEIMQQVINLLDAALRTRP